MTFPAHDQFDRDQRVTPRTLRLYAWCRRRLDFHDVRAYKLATIALETGIRDPHVSTGLSWLVRHGYLVEHPTPPRHPRRLTLAWSVFPPAEIAEHAAEDGPA